MKRGQNARENSRRYLFWAVVVVLVLLSYLIVEKYLVALVSAFVLAYLVHPVFVRLEKKVGKSIAAAICLIVVVSAVILPIVFVFWEITRQSYSYIADGQLTNLLSAISEKVPFKIGLEELGSKGISIVVWLLGSAAKEIPSMLISLVVVLFALFTFLVNWDMLAENLKVYIPSGNKEKVVKEIAKSTNSLVYGTFLIGLIELFVSVIGFYISGMRLFFLFSVLIFFFAFIPGLGPGIVWVPIAIYNFAIGDYFAGAVVLVTGIVLSFGVDFLLRSKILGKSSKINPLIILLGIIGGISLFGVFGFVIGPLILTYTIKILQEAFKD